MLFCSGDREHYTTLHCTTLRLYYLLPTSTSNRYISAIDYTGASRHHLKDNAPHDIAIHPVAPIQLKQPNVQILQSTKGRRLELTTLTDEARESHILPGPVHSYHISIGKICDAGCEAIFNHHTTAVTKDKHVVLQVTRDLMTGLWRVPLQRFDIT